MMQAVDENWKGSLTEEIPAIFPAAFTTRGDKNWPRRAKLPTILRANVFAYCGTHFVVAIRNNGYIIANANPINSTAIKRNIIECDVLNIIKPNNIASHPDNSE